MNALRTVMQRSSLMAARRFATAAEKPSQAFVPNVYKYSYKKAFLSDPATYPLIAILGVACTFMLGMGANALTRYKGVKISSTIKHDTLNNDQSPEYKSVTSFITRRPVGFNAKGLHDIRHEGLGVDHEEFLKAKAKAEAATRSA